MVRRASAKPDTKDETKEKKTKTRDFSSFDIYILRALKQVSPDVSMNALSKKIMNDFIYDIFNRVCVELGRLIEHS